MNNTAPLELFKAAYWESFAGDMAGCEQRLVAITGEPGGSLAESCLLTLEAGGKRLRPLLVFLSSARGTPIGEAHHAAAAAVELVHMATLVHDDILDGADLRRGKPTLAAKYGRNMGVSAGDYLFSSAFRILAANGSARCVAMLSAASLDLSRGELLQMEQTRDFSLAPEAYFERCRLKTASLFSTACMLGAVIGKCSEPVVTAMHDFGMNLGLAFQVADDILDFAGDTGAIGKRAGADLRDGTVTLPLVMALERDDSLPDMLGENLSDALIDEICMRVRDSGGLEVARSRALELVDMATESLSAAAGELDTAPLALIARVAADRGA
ncbi:MAG: polyprenyl synthetase family protein [Actinobacteria bacterium]|nr:polyprenyl synthetase family protein [Actinomycetota bacterium]MCL5882634.1 polyprenyl synthetase family protein [Actinomycetota bacterium]